MSRRSPIDRARVIVHALEGCSYGVIMQKTGFHKSFVERWAQRVHSSKIKLPDLQRMGRPHKLTPAQAKKLIKMVVGKRHCSSRRTEARLRTEKQVPNVCYRTIQNYLHNQQLHPFHRRKCPRLNDFKKLCRRRFSRGHRKTAWDYVLFTDEKQFSRYANINNKNDIIWAYSADAVPAYEVLQGGPKLMVWAGMSSRGVTPLFRIEGNLESSQYVKILERVALPAAAKLFRRRKWLFIQDNSKVHTSKLSERWLQKHMRFHLPKVPLPANSPDLNVIENLWAYVQDQLNLRRFKTVSGLYKSLKQIWAAIPKKLLKHLAQDMPRRLGLVRKAKGGNIRLH